MSMRDIFHGSPFGEGDHPRRVPPLKFKKGIWIILGALLLLAVIVPATATFYTDLLWFRERGLLQVFWTRLLPQWVLFAAAAAAAFVIFSLNWLRARRSAMREIAFASLPGRSSTYPCGPRPWRWWPSPRSWPS